MTLVRLPKHPHDREIVRLAVPALGALVAEPLFLLGDTAIVGRLGTGPLGGLGVASTVLTTLVGICVFLAYGTTAAVARRLGAGDLRAAMRQGIDGLWLACCLGAALLALGWPAAPWVVDVLGASPSVAPYAVTYLRVSLFGLPAMLVVLAGTGVLRGLQDTRTPLVVAATGSAVNLALNAWFVLGLGWGIAGSAVGTVIVQYGSALAYLMVTLGGARRYGASMRPDLVGIRDSATAGVALIVRTLTLRVVIVLATSVAARLGDAEVAAHQVAFVLWSLLALALDSIAIAGQAIIGRLLGASDVTGARQAMRRMILWGVATGAVLGGAVLATRPVLPNLFTSDPAVHTLLASALIVVAALQPLAGIVFALDGILIGAGDARYLAYAGLVTMAAFVPAAYVVLATGGGLVALWLALGVWVVARLITLAVRAHSSAWLVTGASAQR